MELKQLEYFLTVSNTRSFTRAAEQLYISQPSVTTAIQRLEDELGLQLFDRNKKQAVLTSLTAASFCWPNFIIFIQHCGSNLLKVVPAQ